MKLSFRAWLRLTKNQNTEVKDLPGLSLQSLMQKACLLQPKKENGWWQA